MRRPVSRQRATTYLKLVFHTNIKCLGWHASGVVNLRHPPPLRHAALPAQRRPPGPPLRHAALPAQQGPPGLPLRHAAAQQCTTTSLINSRRISPSHLRSQWNHHHDLNLFSINTTGGCSSISITSTKIGFLSACVSVGGCSIPYAQFWQLFSLYQKTTSMLHNGPHPDPA